MIKCKIKKGRPSTFTIGGTASELASETCLVVNQIYKHAKKLAPEAAEAYRTKLLTLLLPPSSPVWMED